MSNAEYDVEIDMCPAGSMSGVQVLHPRDVPLGGPRAMTVRRTLPHRERSFVGAWCFVDHYGPDSVAVSGGMVVPPHPHTGLQTVSWLFEGEIEHRDSSGVHANVRPGEVNLMTGGHGIAHSEVSTANTSVLHGVQLWVVLPTAHRDAPKDFQHAVVPSTSPTAGVELSVFIGSFAGQRADVSTFTELLGAQVEVSAGTRWCPQLRADFEYAVLVDHGRVTFNDVELGPGDLGIIDAGQTQLALTAHEDARLLLLGGVPFEEEVVMWWNFIGPDHQSVQQARDDWQAGSARFGDVAGYDGDRLPAPPLPPVSLRPRGRHGRADRS